MSKTGQPQTETALEKLEELLDEWHEEEPEDERWAQITAALMASYPHLIQYTRELRTSLNWSLSQLEHLASVNFEGTDRLKIIQADIDQHRTLIRDIARE